jgi:integrase/recombinase XerD
VGPLFCIVNGPTRGRPWSAGAARSELLTVAREAGVRRRFAPHQLRHAHAVAMARKGVPLIVIQRQLGHTNLGITSIYLQRIDNAEIIDTLHAPMSRPQLASRLMARIPAPRSRTLPPRSLSSSRAPVSLAWTEMPARPSEQEPGHIREVSFSDVPAPVDRTVSLGYADGDPREAHRAPGPAVLATALVAASVAAVRAWMLHWGATTEETHKALPGDELVATRAASRLHRQDGTLTESAVTFAAALDGAAGRRMTACAAGCSARTRRSPMDVWSAATSSTDLWHAPGARDPDAERDRRPESTSQRSARVLARRSGAVF